MNLYAYVGGNPVNRIDPEGLWFGVDDIITGPVDEIIVLGGLSILAMLGSDIASELLDAIKDALSDVGDGDSCKDPCKGIRDQLKKHQDKLRKYMNDPYGNDNRGFLKNSPPERHAQIIEGRIKNLLKQIENFKRQLEQCEKANGM